SAKLISKLNRGKQSPEKAKLDMIFSFTIKQGNSLADTSDRNAEYPSDIQFFDDNLYILSGYEKKIITYNTIQKQFHGLDRINKVLSSKNEDGSPIFIRVTPNCIVVGYDFKIYIFSQDGDLLKKISRKSHIEFLTVSDKNLFVWSRDAVNAISLTGDFQERLVKNVNEDIDYDQYLLSDNCDMVSQKQICMIESPNDNPKIVLKSQITDTSVDVESSELISANHKDNIWYDWKRGRQIALISRNDGSKKNIMINQNI